MEREAENTAVLGKSDHTSALQEALRYPLVDALTNRRSRRFSLGATLPGGALAYKSKRAPLPLTTSEEAALAFAAAGINGFALGDLPFQEGNLPEGGGGNVIATLTGRTGASADAVHSTALFVINDSGTYLLKRPQDFTLDEIEMLARLAEDHKLEQVYEKMRIKIRDGRTVIEKKVPLTFPFNKWSTNLAGSTYFLPVCELTSMYINVLLSTFDEQMAMFLLDERAKFQPAGIKRFGQSQGGRLHDNPDDSRVASILAIETIIVEFMLAEQAFMVHNLSLMEQAMGLGGWTHFASAQETTWFEVLGFKIGSQRLSQIMNAGPLTAIHSEAERRRQVLSPPPWSHLERRQPDQAVLSALLPLDGRSRSGVPETQANKRHRGGIARALPRLMEGSGSRAGEHSEVQRRVHRRNDRVLHLCVRDVREIPRLFRPAAHDARASGTSSGPRFLRQVLSSWRLHRDPEEPPPSLARRAVAHDPERKRASG